MVAFVAMVLIEVSASIHEPLTTSAIEKGNPEALYPDYRRLRSHWNDSDIAAYIFSYRVAAETPEEELFEYFEQNNKSFHRHEKEAGLLVLRRPVSYSGPGGFDEWRFLHHADSGTVTVLWANLDSRAERRAHEGMIRNLAEIHRGNLAEDDSDIFRENE